MFSCGFTNFAIVLQWLMVYWKFLISPVRGNALMGIWCCVSSLVNKCWCWNWTRKLCDGSHIDLRWSLVFFSFWTDVNNDYSHLWLLIWEWTYNCVIDVACPDCFNDLYGLWECKLEDVINWATNCVFWCLLCL